MPAAKRVSRDQIIDAAVDVLRDGGFSAVNARSVAKKIGCSTQPIYFSFKSMDELKAALTERAIQMHTQRVRDSLRRHEGNDSRYSSYGMGFVKYGQRKNHKPDPCEGELQIHRTTPAFTANSGSFVGFP